ncbi:hypothetical protein WOLCODRAFT_89827 [Wolfiporia cocos MD-104 SS10]|uniref:Uncharacterized protein n=1 Tax=Wolfiporia cocos (strain MD-104) TaxID=742152 RepID=A0A2H3K099_WOLCO|nr:hypothetical protein WOLCODRAFT_89827 [Wolfiporia cocos MD-104 SS10]
MHVRAPSDTAVEYYTVCRSVEGAEPGGFLPVADPITRLTRECSALRLRLATAQRRERYHLRCPSNTPISPRAPPSLRIDPALESAFVHRDASRSQLQIETMKLAERYKALEKHLRELQETLRARDQEIEALRQEQDRLAAERDQAYKERDEERAKAQSLSQTLAREREAKSEAVCNHSHRRHRSRDASRSRHSVRKADLSHKLSLDAEQLAQIRSMDVFMTKTDGWSGAQVIQAVEDLNAEINQFAASVTESCVFARRMRPKLEAGDPSALQEEENAPWLGAGFARVLASRDHAQDPVLVQLALQASLAACCARSLSLFCVGFPSKLDTLLSRVFAHMQAFEPQATSARWRALTHRAIRMLYPGLEEYAITELVATMLRWSATIFALAGTSPTSEQSPPLVPSMHLRRIAEAVYKLARTTREEILSTTFEVVLVDSGATFDEGTMTDKMRDYGEVIAEDHAAANGRNRARLSGQTISGENADGAQARKVLCTTELGLRCVTRKSNKLLDPEEGRENELFESMTLLLPKVVLNSAVEAIERSE